MNKDKVLGILRHVLTFGGGILITKGIVDEAIAAEIVGSLLTLVGAVWSVIAKK